MEAFFQFLQIDILDFISYEHGFFETDSNYKPPNVTVL